jgi:hypothetical protein
MVVLRYLGSGKKRISWVSSGQQFSYVVRPGDVIRLPQSELMKAMGVAPFEIVSEVVIKKPVKVKKPKDKEKDPLVEQVIRTQEETEDVTEVVAKKDKPDPLEKYETTSLSGAGGETQLPPQALVVPEPEEEEPEEFTELDEEETEVLNKVVVEEDTPDVDYCSLRKAELKDKCKEKGLKVSGNRDDLIGRLVMSDIQNNG